MASASIGGGGGPLGGGGGGGRSPSGLRGHESLEQLSWINFIKESGYTHAGFRLLER